LFFTKLNFGKDGANTTGFVYWMRAGIIDWFKD
jgi:hypothetical protein